MESKPRDINDIDSEFFNKMAIVKGVIDMTGILGERVAELDKLTIEGLFIALYAEADQLNKLYSEVSDLARK